MQIKLAKKNNALQIARIHKQEIANGFLSSLPQKFLEKVYICVIENDFCVVAQEGDQIAGFVAGTADIKKLYNYFLKKYFFVSLFLLLPKILNFKKILETLFYSQKKDNLPLAELLSVAVKKDFRGQGVSDKMLAVFEEEMKRRGIEKFKVLVGSDLLPAIKFYERNNFEFIKETEAHKGKKSKIYIK